MRSARATGRAIDGDPPAGAPAPNRPHTGPTNRPQGLRQPPADPPAAPDRTRRRAAGRIRAVRARPDGRRRDQRRSAPREPQRRGA
ncbi:hypothetical protein UK82_18650 [Frankia sp. ACN1ag]|nr:hypothetical protein UK82_18650 [Frankia sp. ACN1ag]